MSFNDLMIIMAKEKELKKAEEVKEYREYIPTLENFPRESKNIIPKDGDYMVATKQHYVNIKKSGKYKMNTMEPHERMDLMYLGEHGLSQCSWGSPAQLKGRAIHSTHPGHWKLGLTPLDTQKSEVKKQKTYI